MLQTIRDRTQGLIVGIIVFLISLTFILWGVESYISAAKRVIVAKVGGDEIGLEEFQQALQRFRRQAESMLGDAFNANEWNGPAIKTKTLDELIDGKLLTQLAAKNRLRVTNNQVAQQLQQIPAFQDDKGFSRQLYQQRVSALGFSQVGFEQQLRDDMAKAQLRTGIGASEFVTRQEAETISALRKQRRDIGYAIIPASAVDQQVTVSDTELSAYYAAHKDDYRTADKARFEYLEISAAALQTAVTVTDDKLRQYYDGNQAQFTLAEERNVNHILVRLAQSADAGTTTAAQIKADNVLKRARAGENFEKLAKELSDDTGTQADGGETGMFGRGAMAPEFEEAAFKLKVSEISDLVRSKFGFHIIKVKEIKAGGLQPFDSVRAQVETAYRNAEAQKAFFEQAEQFSNLVYEHPDSLGVAADKLGVKTQQTEALTQPELAKMFSDKAATIAFQADVLNEGMNSEPIELAEGRVVALRSVEHTPAVVPPLADVRTAVELAVRNVHRRELTAALGKGFIERLRQGATVEDVVKGRGFGWEHVDGALRAAGDANRAVLRAAFSIDVPEHNPVFTGIPMGTTDYAVIRVANVATPAASEIARDEVATVEKDLIKGRMNAAWTDFVAALRAASDVKTYPKNL